MMATRAVPVWWRTFAALAFSAFLVPTAGTAQTASARAKAASQKATLLLAADVGCTVKLDGERVADLVPDEPTKVSVDPGEHLVSASTADGQRWSKVIFVKAPGQTVVKVDFAAAAPVAPRAAPAAPASKGAVAAVGTLLVFTDAPIDLEIDGKAAGSLSGTPEAPGKRAFTLTPGKHFLKAVSKESSEVSAAADVQIREGAQEIVRAMVADQIAERQAQRERLKRFKEKIDASFVPIPAGSFEMGCSEDDKECEKVEKSRHTVRITKPFQMMKTEVTWAWFRDWALLGGHEPPSQPGWSGDDSPVVNVTWNDAQAFCSAFGGRLPTEAEWEYAARGGTSTARYGALGEVAWYDGNSGRQAHPVAGKKANGLGLYDMLGNVWEWCADWYGEEYYKEKVEMDPAGPSSGEYRVLLGGSWVVVPGGVRASYRFSWLTPTKRDDNVGFRCLRDGNSPVTFSSSPEIQKLDKPQIGTIRSGGGSGSSARAAPAALVAEDFSEVKRQREEARRQEEEAKRQAAEAARIAAEQKRQQEAAQAQAEAEQDEVEDRAYRAEMGRQIGSMLGGLGQAIATNRAVRQGDLSSFGIQSTPVPTRPTYTAPAAPSSAATRASPPSSPSTAQPAPAQSGARIVTGYVPPAPTPRPVLVAANPLPASNPIPAPPTQLPCTFSQTQYCTIIRLVNTSGIQVDQAYVNSDRAGGLLPGGTFDKIHDPLPSGVAVDAFSSTGVGPDGGQVEWHLSLNGPLSPCQGYVVYLDPGGAWRTGPSFTKNCVH